MSYSPSLSFLEKHLQYVRIGSHASDVRELNAGFMQETIAGPNDLKVLIYDLHFELPCIKYCASCITRSY